MNRHGVDQRAVTVEEVGAEIARRQLQLHGFEKLPGRSARGRAAHLRDFVGEPEDAAGSGGFEKNGVLSLSYRSSWPCAAHSLRGNGYVPEMRNMLSECGANTFFHRSFLTSAFRFDRVLTVR